uniref:Uncharacterized protein n=3 Tax=Parascaris univalens TaxID=6257 RepID=A0A915CF51_PARUN
MRSIIIAIVVTIWFIIHNRAADLQQASSVALFANRSRCYRNDGFKNDSVRRSDNSTYCYYSPELIMNITRLELEMKRELELGKKSKGMQSIQDQDNRTLIAGYCNRTKDDTILTIENNESTTFLLELSREFLKTKHGWKNATVDVCVFAEFAKTKNATVEKRSKKFSSGCLGDNGKPYSRKSEVVLIICQFKNANKTTPRPAKFSLQEQILSNNTAPLENPMTDSQTVRNSAEGNNSNRNDIIIEVSTEVAIDQTVISDLSEKVDSISPFMNASTRQPEMSSMPVGGDGGAAQGEPSSPFRSKKDADRNMTIALIILAAVVGGAELGSLTFVILVYNNAIS